MTRLLLRIVASALALALLLVISVWLFVRASLPQLDGDVEVAGLSASVTIARDHAGIPVITAASRPDLAFATGFAHGQDRFFQMDLIRRQAAGELAELFGVAALETDKHHRFHRFRALAGQILQRAGDDERRIIERYADGVNAGLDSLGARPFEYLLLQKRPEPWRAEDTVIVVYAMFMQLNDSRARKDVRRGLAHRLLPREAYDWLYPVGTPWDAPLMGTAREPLPYPRPDVYSVRAFESISPPANEKGRPPLDGSNNWAVSGILTASGRALVSNDMHLGLSTPNIYYQARLRQLSGRTRDVTGVTLPGTPFVVAGSNGNIAWGYTNSYGDWSDAVVIKAGKQPNTYRTAEGDRDFVEHNETIHVDGGEPIDYEIRETIWGPVDDSVSYPDGEIAVSWIAHKPVAVNLKIMQLETAATVAEALAIASTMGMPPQNFVAGDAGGNIGWTIAGQIPVRDDYDPMVPADWSERSGWLGWLVADEYPRIVNPADGRIWSANARVVDGDALELVGDGGYDFAARAAQIRDSLFAQQTFVPEDMLAIQMDDRAVFLARWRKLLLELLDDDVVADDADLLEYRKLVESWLPRAAPQSVGYRLVRSFRLEVRSRVFYGLTGPVRESYDEEVDLLISNQFEAPLWQLVTQQPMHLLPANYANWNALLLAAVRENIAWFHSKYDSPLGHRTWGEYNTAAIQHPLSRAVPVLADWLDMPRDALNGDSNLPKAQGPGFGASERFSVSPGDEHNGLMHMPTGQSGHPLSEFYRKGHEDWVHGRPSPFLPGDAAHTLTLRPLAGSIDTTDG